MDSGHPRQAGVTVRGIVTACDWDADHSVTAVAICSADERDYIVRAKPTVRVLLGHVDQLIEATGRLVEGQTGGPTFVMDRFEAIGDQLFGEGGWGRQRRDDPQGRGDRRHLSGARRREVNSG